MKARCSVAPAGASAAMLALVAHVALAACQGSPSPGVVKDAPSAAATGAGAKASPAGASAAPAAPDRPADPKAGGGVRVVVASQDADALSQIRTERLKAKAEGRVLAVYVSATWCEPCKRFKQEIEAGRLDAQLARTTLLAFDADRDQDRLGSAGYTYRFVPYVALPGADGAPADAAEAKGKGGGAWRDVATKLEEWQARTP